MSCPWRSFYVPIVKEVIHIAILSEKGLGTAAMDDDPPAILLDALSVYLSAKNSTAAHDVEQRKEERQRKKGNRHG